MWLYCVRYTDMEGYECEYWIEADDVFEAKELFKLRNPNAFIKSCSRD